MKDSDSNILARIDERTIAQGMTLAAQNVALTTHVKEDGEKFEKVFQFVSKSFDKMDQRFDKIDEKFEATNKKIDDGLASAAQEVKPLQTANIRRDSVVNAGRTAILCLWAMAVIAIGHFWK